MEQVTRDVPLSQIGLDRHQPRMNRGDLESLKASIRQHSILQPPVLTPAGEDRDRILASEHSFTAAKELAWPTIDVIVRSDQEQRRTSLPLVENIQRKQLPVFGQGASFREVMDQHGLRQEQLVSRIGESQDYIRNAAPTVERIRGEIRKELSTFRQVVVGSREWPRTNATPGGLIQTISQTCTGRSGTS